MKRSLFAIATLAGFATLAPLAPAQRPPFSDPEVRKASVLDAQQRSERDQAAALEIARRSGLRVVGETRDGNRYFLDGLTENGTPRFRALLSTKAAIGSGADVLQQPPYGVVGDGLIVGVWDGGGVMDTHVEYNQTGPSRIFNSDGAPIDHHATAVTGLILAGGVDVDSLGAAPEALAECYDLFNDMAELTPRVSIGPEDSGNILISNHAYGDLHGWQAFGGSGPLGAGDYYFGPNWNAAGTGPREDLNFGRYGEAASELDTLLHNAPYYIFVKSCGNDRNQVYNGPTDGTGTFYYWDGNTFSAETWELATAPFDDDWDNGGFDTMIDNANAKNVIAVGAIDDPTSGGLRDPDVASMAVFSSWGPTDDGRVKPDFVSRGVNTRVPVANGNYTNTASGTSFSAPNVSGTALLYLELLEQEIGTRLRGSTVKGLLAHTASDLGRPGPDYEYGWGLPDGEKTGELVAAHVAAPGAFHIVEGLLSDANASDSYVVSWDGTEDLVATICWYDPPAAPLPFVLDDLTPALVNDLDLRINGPARATYEPWKLDPLNPLNNATNGDNLVDTIEQIIVPAGTSSGTFDISVSHKGTLDGGHQWYSLFISGQSAQAAAAPSLSAADPAAASYDQVIEIDATGGGFQPGAQLLLRRTGFSDIEATSEFSSPEQLFATIDLTGAEAGLWDVVAELPDGQEATLVEGFTVLSAAPQVSGPTSLLIREGETLAVDFGASDPDMADGVTLVGSSLASWASFAPPAAGNPTTGTLTLTPDYNIAPTTETMTLTATDNATFPSAVDFDLEVVVLNTPIVDAVIPTSATELEVTFDSSMSESGPGSVLDAGAYSIETTTRATLTVSAVSHVSGDTYSLTTDSQTVNESYTLTITGVTDANGNAIASEAGFGSVAFFGFDPSGVSDWFVVE